MMNRKSPFLILCLTLLLGLSASAHEARTANHDRASRKKVAVVLCGGGAKGMAHVGVLKVLERAGIPVDMITGTSMGSIVGGLYAIGYNAESLDSLVRRMDWSYIITDREDMRRQNLTDREKQYTYVFSTGKSSGHRNMNAGGIFKGNNVEALLGHLCTGYTDSLNFTRDLPIPFACVATNIMDNSEIVFHSGKLPQAMRASMAIPGAFSPVRMGDMILVDGCMRNNYPADVARDMGADIIIGVTLSGKPKKADEIVGTMSVISQLMEVTTNNKYEENIAITDLHINVDPRDFSVASFSAEAVDSLVRYGEEEAMKYWDEIVALKQRIGVSENYRPRLLHPQHPEVLAERRHVTRFVFENMTPQAERFLKQKFHLDSRDSIDAQLEGQLTTSMRVDLFYNSAECRLVPEDDGVRVVLTAGDRKSLQWHTGIRFDTEEYVALQIGLEIPLKTSIPINTDLTVRLGKRMMGRAAITVHPTNFTRPTMSFTFYHNDIDLYILGDRDYNTQFNRAQAELTPLNFDWRHFNMRLGVRWDYMHYHSQLGAGIMKDVELKNEHYYSYRANVNYNSEDNWYFPTRGSRLKAEYAYITDNFARLENKIGMSEVNANWRTSFTFGNSFTLQPMLYGRLLFGAVVPIIYGSVIGGDWFGHYLEQQMPFAGVGNIEYVERQFVAAQLQAQQHIGTNNYIQVRLAAAQQAERVRNLLDSSTMLGGQVSYYYNTMFGPLGATLGYSNHTKKGYFFVNLGYAF